MARNTVKTNPANNTQVTTRSRVSYSDLASQAQDISEYREFTRLTYDELHRLVGVPFIIVDWMIRESELADKEYALMWVVASNDRSYVISLGSEDIVTAVRSFVQGTPVACPNGLRARAVEADTERKRPAYTAYSFG